MPSTVSLQYDATLDIIGDGLQTNRLQKQAQRFTYAGRVTFRGFLDDYDLESWMEAERLSPIKEY